MSTMLLFLAIIIILPGNLTLRVIMVDKQQFLCYIKQKGDAMSEYSSTVQKVPVTCTDNGNTVDAVVDNFKPKKYMDVIMANQRIKLSYNAGYGKVYVGNAYGLEFTAYDKDIYTD